MSITLGKDKFQSTDFLAKHGKGTPSFAEFHCAPEYTHAARQVALEVQRSCAEPLGPEGPPDVLTGAPHFGIEREYKSIYFLTLTSTKDDPYELRQWFAKILVSKMFGVVGYYACMELTEAGMPHIHAMLFSYNKYNDASKIKSALEYPYRYELVRSKSPQHLYDYIHKGATNPAYTDYCIKKGIKQFMSHRD